MYRWAGKLRADIVIKYIISSTATCIHSDTLHEQQGKDEIETERRYKKGKKEKRKIKTLRGKKKK
jgi:hypothetical protein